MEQRKQKIIDRKFQLKTTFSVMGIFFVMIVLLIALVGFNVINDNSKISDIISDMTACIDRQQATFESALNGEIQDKEKISSEFNSGIDAAKTGMKTLQEISHRNTMILVIILGFFFSLGYILYSILIRKTHKISGPIVLMSNYLRNLLDGRDAAMRPLRKDDEFQEFYGLFRKYVESKKEKD